MCGISGFNWRDRSKASVMVAALSHRGPDASGIFTTDDISLGHNRLSVIDLSSVANQPMTDSSGELTIVYNGEIYNFQQIRRELKGGYRFRTKSDTEVILAGYRKWGRGVVDKLNGMFAFAIWNQRTKELFCARDHAGIKPFYYFWDGKRFIFASEVKAILTHDVPRKLNLDAFNHYFRVLYTPEPMTLIKNIYKLSPSSVLTFQNGRLSISRYGCKKQEPARLPYSESVSVLRQKVIDAVGGQLVADVPVGVYLSGGIDSSAVLFSMTQFYQKIKTFSVGFELNQGEESVKFNQDFKFAERTAKFFGTEHFPVVMSVRDVLESLEGVVEANDDPISNPTSIAMMILARRARKEVTVVLTGNGGDELFGGYERYRLALVAQYYMKFPRSIRSITGRHSKLAKLGHESVIDLFSRFMFQKDDKLSRVLDSLVFKPEAFSKKYFQERYFSKDRADLVERLMFADQSSWLSDQAFALSDRMSMASALEERVPLVDRDLMSFASSLPRSYKVNLFRTKKILKDAFKKDLPAFLFEQPKRGWFSPGAKWLRNPSFSKFAWEVFSADYYSGTSALFDWSEVQRIYDKHLAREEYNLTILWAVFTFQLWAKRYKIVL